MKYTMKHLQHTMQYMIKHQKLTMKNLRSFAALPLVMGMYAPIIAASSTPTPIDANVLKKLTPPLTTYNAFINPPQSLINELNTLSREYARPKPLAPTTTPLFKTFPALHKTIPHISLGDFPTPIHHATELGKRLHFPSLYIKRDDLSGPVQSNGTRLYGGNKVRKLEHELAQAVTRGAASVMTFGVVGSSHVLATAVYAQQLGLSCIAMTKPEPNSHEVREKLLQHLQCNTQLHHYPNNAWRNAGMIMTWWEGGQRGSFPYLIPTGCSSPLGAVGFVNAAFELKEQITAGVMPEPDYIYLACGSMGSAVGLLLGIKAAGLKSHLVPVVVEPCTQEECTQEMARLFHQTNDLLHDADHSFPLFPLAPDDLPIRSGFEGPDYGVFTPEGNEARVALKAAGGIVLDGTYTAKACAAMLDDIRHNRVRNKTILFWNTYCGLDVVERTCTYHQLPQVFHCFFEQDVQELDQ